MNLRLETQMHRAGWRAGRSVTLADVDDALTAAGYKRSAALTDVLTEFSGLTFRSDDGKRSVWIDGARAAMEADQEWVQAYESLAHSTLTPIGGYSHMTLLIDDGGQVFGGFDREFGRLGGNLREVLDGLLNQNPMPRLDLRVEDD